MAYLKVALYILLAPLFFLFMIVMLFPAAIGLLFGMLGLDGKVWDAVALVIGLSISGYMIYQVAVHPEHVPANDDSYIGINGSFYHH